MNASAPERKKLPEESPEPRSGRPFEPLLRWAWRLGMAAAILSAIGYFSTPTVSPLMCKVYG